MEVFPEVLITPVEGLRYPQGGGHAPPFADPWSWVTGRFDLQLPVGGTRQLSPQVLCRRRVRIVDS